MAHTVSPQHSDSEELRLLYQVTTTDLAYFKTQQWSVTYYCLLIDAGLVGIGGILKPLTALDRLVLGVLTFLAALAALVVLAKLEKSISVRESRLEALRESLGSAFERAWRAEDKGREYIHAIQILFVGVIVTSLLTLWLVGMRL